MRGFPFTWKRPSSAQPAGRRRWRPPFVPARERREDWLTPAVVHARLGFVRSDVSLGKSGDRFQLNGTTLTDATRPANNFINSSSTSDGRCHRNVAWLRNRVSETQGKAAPHVTPLVVPVLGEQRPDLFPALVPLSGTPHPSPSWRQAASAYETLS
jgi:hypothetical protein